MILALCFISFAVTAGSLLTFVNLPGAPDWLFWLSIGSGFHMLLSAVASINFEDK